jgi:hypothetical protein
MEKEQILLGVGAFLTLVVIVKIIGKISKIIIFLIVCAIIFLLFKVLEGKLPF